MPTLRLLDPRDVAALREDALSSLGNVGRLRRKKTMRFVAPLRVTVRLGDEPVRDVKHMNQTDWRNLLRRGYVVYRKRAPICRACGHPIRHGQKAVAFTLFSTDESPNGRDAFVHDPTCPRDSATVVATEGGEG